MEATQMKNLSRNYCLEKQINEKHFNYNFFKYKKVAYNNALPNLGINGGHMINGYYHNVLSNNTCDIESTLYGIRSSDLVNGPFHKTISPDLNKLNCVSFFNNRLKRYIPEPLIVEKNQRPSGPYSSQ
tara:strand:+ start:181 stop:564 length:384 start_codon:yes stop_codon:yes gene_type:complete